MNTNLLANLKIKIDINGNLYVEVPDGNDPCTYTIVYLNVAEDIDKIDE